jgi:hypothetical protein
MVTPQAAAWAAVGNRKARVSAPTMARFRSTGAKAAAAKWRWAFSVPECSVTRVMKSR